MLSHVTGGYDTKFPDGPKTPINLWWGQFGVQLFFLISGYVILMSARRARRPSDFVISRVSRLYPVYWIALVCTIVLATASGTWWVPDSPKIWLLNILMFQRVLMIPNVDEVYWTLAIEMQFYALILVILYLTRSRLTDKVITILAGSWMTASIIGAVIVGPASRGLNPKHVATMDKVILNIVLIEWAPLFCAGMFTYLARGGEGRRYWWWAGTSGVLAIVVAALLHHPAYAAFVAGNVVIFFAVCAHSKTKLLLTAPFQWVGKVSYSLYVNHLLLVTMLTHMFYVTCGVPRVPSMLIAIALCLMWAGVLHQVGEVWASRHMKAALLNLQSRLLKSPTPDKQAC